MPLKNEIQISIPNLTKIKVIQEKLKNCENNRRNICKILISKIVKILHKINSNLG